MFCQVAIMSDQDLFVILPRVQKDKNLHISRINYFFQQKYISLYIKGSNMIENSFLMERFFK